MIRQTAAGVAIIWQWAAFGADYHFAPRGVVRRDNIGRFPPSAQQLRIGSFRSPEAVEGPEFHHWPLVPKQGKMPA